MAESRRAYVKIEYDGKDITEALSRMIVRFEYVDKASGEADELNLTCQDKENKWINEWYPKKVTGG